MNNGRMDVHAVAKASNVSRLAGTELPSSRHSMVRTGAARSRQAAIRAMVMRVETPRRSRALTGSPAKKGMPREASGQSVVAAGIEFEIGKA